MQNVRNDKYFWGKYQAFHKKMDDIEERKASISKAIKINKLRK